MDEGSPADFQSSGGIDPMMANILVILIVFGYAGFLVCKLVQGKVTGKGNPFSCSGECRQCRGCTDPEQQELLYREISESMEKR